MYFSWQAPGADLGFPWTGGGVHHQKSKPINLNKFWDVGMRPTQKYIQCKYGTDLTTYFQSERI